MTETAAIILYYQYLSTPGNVYLPFLAWYHESDIEIKSDLRTRRLIKLTGYPGSTTWAEVYAWVRERIRDALNAITRLDDILRLFTENLINALKNVFKSIGTVVTNIIEFIRDGIASMVSTITSIITNVTAWIKATLIVIKDSLVNVVTSVKEFLEAVYLRVKEAIIGAIDAGINAVKTAVAWAGKTISTILKWLGEKIIAIKDWIVNAVKVSVAWAGETFQKVWTTLTKVYETIKDWFQKMIDTIVSWFKAEITKEDERFKELRAEGILAATNSNTLWAGVLNVDFDAIEKTVIDVAARIVKIQQDLAEKIGEATT
ncbi:MAG: hypothetical protein FVQ79_12170 [Planctomycetes bacterium]|nr:hypothetical protein [Planctomycetota bacterium]